jgi:hypothetical protein
MSRYALHKRQHLILLIIGKAIVPMPQTKEVIEMSILVKFEKNHDQAMSRLENRQAGFLYDNIDAIIEDAKNVVAIKGKLRGQPLIDALTKAGYAMFAGRENAAHDKLSAIGYLIQNAADIKKGVLAGSYDNVTHIRGIKKKHQELTAAPTASKKRQGKSGQGKKAPAENVAPATKWKETNAKNWQAQFAAIEDFCKASGIDFDLVVSFWNDEANEKSEKIAATM